ncbi:hypothetical protein [Blastomonas sp.]|uniref:hypothetical protein n=1 Tax=Blastomonas sp. TaxID=1909299 RepID=UPI003919D610
MSMISRDNLAAIERVRIEADRLTLVCSTICGAVPVALAIAFAPTVTQLPREIQHELDRTKGVRQ